MSVVALMGSVELLVFLPSAIIEVDTSVVALMGLVELLVLHWTLTRLKQLQMSIVQPPQQGREVIEAAARAFNYHNQMQVTKVNVAWCCYPDLASRLSPRFFSKLQD